MSETSVEFRSELRDPAAAKDSKLTVTGAIVILNRFREFIQACCVPRLSCGCVCKSRRVAVEL